MLHFYVQKGYSLRELQELNTLEKEFLFASMVLELERLEMEEEAYGQTD